ncbi:MAG TPA: hypothetical protein VNU45_07845, partial [Rummeliibacillus sp.]|nr:hypothetical protein [Rummeliibacillus sp.]
FNTSATIISTIIALVLLIGISIWAKSWAVLIILGLLLLPDLVFHQFDINTETQLILSSVITFGGIGLYIYLSSNIRNAKA